MNEVFCKYELNYCVFNEKSTEYKYHDPTKKHAKIMQIRWNLGRKI